MVTNLNTVFFFNNSDQMVKYNKIHFPYFFHHFGLVKMKTQIIKTKLQLSLQFDMKLSKCNEAINKNNWILKIKELEKLYFVKYCNPSYFKSQAEKFAP